MPEERVRKYRRDRVAEALREEISAMIEGELSDPRISFCYITEVAMNPGNKSARVFVAVDGGLEAETETIQGLIGARGYIRHELTERLGMHHVPELTFHVDRSEKIQNRIDDLMLRQRKRQKAAESKAQPATAPAQKPAK